MEHNIERALSRCPFLHNLCEKEGRAYAASIAINPLVPASRDGLRRRPILEEERDFAATFRLFHGEGGAFPLPAFAKSPLSAASTVSGAASSGHAVQASINTASSARCPFSNGVNVAPQPDSICEPVRKVACNPLAGAPLATLSLGMPDFGELFRRLQQGRPKPKPKPSARKPPSSRPDIKPSATGSSSITQGPPQVSPAPPPGPVPAPSPGPAAAAAGGTCPLRAWLGPYAGIVFNKAGHLQCPEPIIRARAALAATQTVRTLRPQALPVKLIAVGAIAAAANVPCGMWREHTEKFSFQWILAVHASIPFIAMLRKAVIMPKLAIVCTIAAAVAGQAIGARLERERIRQLASASSEGCEDELGVQSASAARLLQGGTVVAAAVKRGPVAAPKRVKAFKTRPVAALPAYSASEGLLSLEPYEPMALSSLAEWRMDGVQQGSRAGKRLLALPPAVPAY